MTTVNKFITSIAEMMGLEELLPSYKEKKEIDDQIEELLLLRVGRWRDDCEQLQVQLAGCLTAAQGFTSQEYIATKGMYGWSTAYQNVLELRRRHDKMLKILKMHVGINGELVRDESNILGELRISADIDEGNRG